MSSGKLIAVDWGTSNFRAFLVDRQSGECLDSRHSDAGLRSLSSAEFPHYCAAQVGDWREEGRVPVYLAGMVGAKRGWAEAPQLELPVDSRELAKHLLPAPGLDNAWIVPGVKMLQPEHVDVMRGEEIQAFGALTIANEVSALCCLPGTHSKWAQLEKGRMVAFTTAMTGELYHVMRHHTLPGEPARNAAEFDAGAFHQGLRASEHPAGVLHALFEARSRYLYAGLAAEQVGSFLSGVLIGSEVSHQRAIHGTTMRILLVGSSALNGLYRLALESAGFQTQEIDSNSATLAGLCALAERHGANIK